MLLRSKIDVHLPIMVVDDAKFSTAVIARTLTKAGFQDVRYVNNGEQALAALSERPVKLLLSDWLMPKMDGLQLTQQVRKLDESSGRYTYIILLTSREGVETQAQAFDNGVDDFVNKSVMNMQLLPRIFAAERMVKLAQQPPSPSASPQEAGSSTDDREPFHELMLQDYIKRLSGLNFDHPKLDKVLSQCEDLERIYELIAIIPQGYVTTFGRIAQMMGRPKFARNVGSALKSLPMDSPLPWHRVMTSKGELVKPVDGERSQYQCQLLSNEGITIENGRVNLNQFLWHPSASDKQQHDDDTLAFTMAQPAKPNNLPIQSSIRNGNQDQNEVSRLRKRAKTITFTTH